MAGWVPDTNAAKIQGACSPSATQLSKMGMVEDFTGPQACIKGTAAKVDTTSDVCKNKMFTPPATDCYGAVLGRRHRPEPEPGDRPDARACARTPVPYDATALQGLRLRHRRRPSSLAGTDFRFKVEDGTKEYCTPKAVKVKKGFQHHQVQRLDG